MSTLCFMRRMLDGPKEATRETVADDDHVVERLLRLDTKQAVQYLAVWEDDIIETS